jgi:hypothetical protein
MCGETPVHGAQEIRHEGWIAQLLLHDRPRGVQELLRVELRYAMGETETRAPPRLELARNQARAVCRRNNGTQFTSAHVRDVAGMVL